MKKTNTIFMMLFLIISINTALSAQSTHTIDFEPEGIGADWEWTVTENGDNPPLEFISNPDNSGINSSVSVAQFIARQTGQPWALCFTDDDGEFTFDAANSTVTIMVHKPLISNIAIKFEGASAPVEIQIANTVTDQWEELTFDFSASIGNTYDRLIIIPDFTFDPRPQDNFIYFDNIQVPDGEVLPPPNEPTVAAPDPTHDEINVISIYSDVYTNLPGTDFNPNWGQSTLVTVDYLIDGNNTIKYENLNYQGTQFTNQDVSTYEYLHVDFWTPNSTSLDFFLISPGNETFYTLPITLETWVSVDIPLTDYVPPVDLSDVFQFKVTGNGTVWFDNWYFWKSPFTPGSDATLSDLRVDDVTIDGFSPTILNYNMELPNGTSIVPEVTATTNDPEASYVVNDATALPGTTQVVVTAEDNTTMLTYNVNFTLTPSIPEVAAPTPTIPEEDVISLFSNAYTDVPVDTWSAAWDQADLEDIQIEGNDTKLYTNLVFAGIEFTSQTIDATAMTHFHLDVWTPDDTSAPAVFKVKLVDFGADGAWAGGDDVEHELTFDENTMDSETWVLLDIPLADFVNLTTTGHLAQLIISGDPNTVYIDNVFFYSVTTYDPPENVFVDPSTWLCTWSPPGGSIIHDDFESYNVGEYLAVQSDWWTTWSNAPGTGEDAFISNEQALSGIKSLKIDANAAVSDLVLIMEDYAAGIYEVELHMFIPTGGHGYFNLQKSTTPGEEWGFQVDFPASGTAVIDAGGFGAAQFGFVFDEWLDLLVRVDLDSDWAEFYYSSTLIHEYQWSLGTDGVEGLHTLGGMNIYANGADALFYVDDLDLRPVAPTRPITGYNVFLDNTQLESNLIYYQYQFTGLTAGQEYTAGVQTVYDDGVSEISEYVFTAESSPVLPPENLSAVIQNYNNVFLTWDAPSAASSLESGSQSDIRILLGYNIYRDDEEIGFVAAGTLEYLDEGLNAGDYSYHVTGVYDNGESDPSTPATVMVTLPAPLNFSANSQGDNGNIICTWNAPAEIRNLTGYKIYRDNVEIGTSTGTFYLDMGVPTGTYIYHATAMYNEMYESEASNQVEVNHVDADDTAIPLVTELSGNYPNPFNPVTSIKFSLHEKDHVRIDIYNIRGERISTLVDGELDPAFYTIVWNGTDDNQSPVTSGVYFYKMQAGKFSSTRKMILMK